MDVLRDHEDIGTHVSSPQRISARLWVIAAVVVCAAGIMFGNSDPGSPGITVAADVTQLVLSAIAAAAAARAAHRSTGRLRTSWRWLAAGVGGWSLGQLIWTCYEVLGEDQAPFPSLADAGFLFLPVAIAIGLWLFPSNVPPGIRLRNVLDACVVVGSLVAISWSLVLGATFRAATDGAFAAIVSMAYPIGDVLLISMVIYSLSRPSPYRRTQVLVALAMVAMAGSDGPFAYLSARDQYLTGSLADLGWVTAFVLMTVAALTGYAADPPREKVATNDGDHDVPSMLPYVPLLLAVAVCARNYFDTGMDTVEASGIALAVIALLGRQYLTLRENRNLLDEVHAGQVKLRQQATMDLLTGLANRALFTDRVTHALELHQRDLRPLALLFCDLDDFKAVNDTYGHPAGDELLIRVSERLRGALRTGDTLARFGGDEFAILIEDGGEAALVGSRIIEALQAPFIIKGSQLSIRVSVGVMELDAEAPSPPIETLMTQADIAMYAAKRSGKGKLALYDPAMTPPTMLALPLQTPLAEAVRAGQITAVYQPVVSLSDGRVIGFEALARWRHEGADIPPAQFIPLAIRSGLISELTTAMLEQACADLAGWSERLGHHELQVAVNVPPSLISDRGLPARLNEVMKRHGLVAGQIVVELTEDALVGDIETARAVTRELNELQVPLALDDFGTGYSSLVHLQQIPLGSLKIAMGFVENVDRDERAAKLIKALLGLGRDLGLNIIADGVERASQADLLRDFGCPMAQGRYFAPAVPASEVEQLLNRLERPGVAAR